MKHHLLPSLLLTALLTTAAPVLAQTTDQSAALVERIAELKKRAVQGVEARAKLAQEMNDSIFSFGELAFQEFETSKYITDILEKNGFSVQRNVAGLPTGWVAKWGSGGPVIAFGSDIDCIPKASQKPGVAYREPMIEGAPGHGEGHNSGQALNVVAALALKELMEQEKIPGTIMLWPGVAEELLGGKAYMVRDGVFNGVDAVLFTHVGNNLETTWGQPRGTGMVSVEYTYSGESAHSASAPWRGRSALDGVELMNIGWNMRREHLRPEQRSHYVIPDGGDQPNVVPSVASVWYFIREQDFANIRKNFEIANTISEAAAKMTDTTVTRKVIGTAAPRHFNKPIAEAAYANIQQVGLP
ncbi:amidohydrolase, partial [Microvirga sp. 0TCS3.31]